MSEATSDFQTHLTAIYRAASLTYAGEMRPMLLPPGHQTKLHQVFKDEISTAYTRGSEFGVNAERARCKAILSSTEAKDRLELASHLAFETDTAVADALAIMAKTPAVKAAANVNTAFVLAMERLGNPKVGANAEIDGEDAYRPVRPEEIFAARAAARKETA